MSARDALSVAIDRGLDLVEVAPNARPPVCRIMDYGKHRYEQSKRDKAAKKKQKITNIKEIRMSPKIDEHDFDVKFRAAERFLKSGDKVKVSAVVERPPKLEGRHMIAVLAPRTDSQKAETSKAETVEANN